MASIADIMQLCRLCLVKEQVNVPIFEDQDDAGQIFVKITACLPVKISKEDRLPKKICDGCQYKLDLLYQFCNTTTNAEKQLLSWLTAAGPDTNENITKTTDESNSVSKFKVNLKTEPNNESCDSLSIETKSYILQQQQLPYESDEFPFQEDDFEEQTTTSAEAPAIIKDVEQPPSKKRRTAAPTLLQEPPDESDEDIEYATVEEPEKTEEESEDDTLVEPSLIEVLNVQDEQPGPSGIGKTEAQSPTKDIFKKYERLYGLKKCVVLLGSLKKLDTNKYTLVKSRPIVDLYLDNVIDSPRTKYKCEVCGIRFKDYSLLKSHRVVHKNDDVESDSSYFYCDETSASSSSEEDVIKESKTYVCKFCNIRFKNSQSYAAHSKKHKREKIKTPQEENIHKEEIGKATKGFCCTLCTHVSYTEIDLATHFLNVHGKDSDGFSCEICFSQFEKFDELLQHNTFKHPLICNVCNIKFKRYEMLTAHRFMLHSVANPTTTYSCKKCSVKFNDMCKLKLHMKAHEKSEEKKNNDAKRNLNIKDEKMVKCDLCLKPFRNGEELQIHLSTHFSIVKVIDNEQPDKLPKSGEEKVAEVNTQNGVKVSQNSPKLKCTVCYQTFSNKKNLSIHLKQHIAKQTLLNKSLNNKTTTLLKNIAPATLKPSPPTPQSSEVLTPITMPIVSTSALTFPVHTSIPLQSTIANSNISLSTSIPVTTTHEPIAINQNQAKVLFLNDNRYIILPQGVTPISDGGVIKIHQPIQTSSDRQFQNIPSYNIVAQPMNNFLQQSINQTIVLPNNQDNSQINISHKTFNTINATNMHVNTSSSTIPANATNSVDQSKPKKKVGNSKIGECPKKYTRKPKVQIKYCFTAETPISPKIINKKKRKCKKNDLSPEECVVMPSNINLCAKPNISQENNGLSPEESESSNNLNLEKNNSIMAVEENVVQKTAKLCEEGLGNQKELVSVLTDFDSSESNLIIDENPTTIDKLVDTNEDNSSTENFKPKIFLKPLSQLLENPAENKQETISKSISNAEEVVVYPSTSTTKPETKSKQYPHKLYKCNMCNVFCKRSLSKLSRHQNKFKCKVCTFTCCKLKLMDQHYELIHNYKNRCASCDKQFPTAVALQNHKREVHLCVKCNKCYLDINKHKQSFKCLHCDFKACNAYNLDTHYKIVHAITTRCTPCNRVFYSPESFVKHKEEMHYCSRCKTYKMDLNIHQSFCKGESPNNKTDEIEQVIELDSD